MAEDVAAVINSNGQISHRAFSTADRKNELVGGKNLPMTSFRRTLVSCFILPLACAFICIGYSAKALFARCQAASSFITPQIFTERDCPQLEQKETVNASAG